MGLGRRLLGLSAAVRILGGAAGSGVARTPSTGSLRTRDPRSALSAGPIADRANPDGRAEHLGGRRRWQPLAGGLGAAAQGGGRDATRIGRTGAGRHSGLPVQLAVGVGVGVGGTVAGTSPQRERGEPAVNEKR